MGFNSWNGYHCNIDENIVKSMATAMLNNGMANAGYSYVNIDDCWQVAREFDNQSIVADPVRFPSGMAQLAEDIHAMGMKFGVYTARGSGTCQGRPGSLNHEVIDAQTYCDWDLDYIKANLWRTHGDIQANFGSVLANIYANDVMASVAKPGHFNDPDMLQVGNPGLSDDEGLTHFALWCIASAPLLAGTDLIHASNTTLAILTAPELIAVNQDLGYNNQIQGRNVKLSGMSDDTVSFWVKRLASGDYAIVVVNEGSAPASNVKIPFTDLGLSAGPYALRDLWRQTDVGQFSDSYTIASINSHASFSFKLTSAN
ncbi:uncharacterized protein MONBRDRAFT_7758 [Monosiga brevicollis MX1]|uniref:Alpha-galactosidase n=1 Tax=Monosiga brevicollis TaxID=81824 RepID=A9UY80_MONBE|nr:uncharacterized protein MONBRDRAFT_7758 [Monosiga brevicollis MX1]EDQ89811.1 predicted protein [Monosiga brevicollis MX1]|eukprot:XP_001745233.1 hypothetical protein [Monosiga brevicollis MX1]